jgi:hypothetical protein
MSVREGLGMAALVGLALIGAFILFVFVCVAAYPLQITH